MLWGKSNEQKGYKSIILSLLRSADNVGCIRVPGVEMAGTLLRLVILLLVLTCPESNQMKP